jgi:hypothetical protein
VAATIPYATNRHSHFSSPTRSAASPSLTGSPVCDAMRHGATKAPRRSYNASSTVFDKDVHQTPKRRLHTFLVALRGYVPAHGDRLLPGVFVTAAPTGISCYPLPQTFQGVA